MRTIACTTTARIEASWFGQRTKNRHLIGSKKSMELIRCMRFNKKLGGKQNGERRNEELPVLWEKSCTRVSVVALFRERQKVVI
jgi:hypothetical protein